MDAKLQQFVERLMSTSPQYTDVFGRGLPGMAGASVAASGATNSATDITSDLQRETVHFASLYVNKAVSAAILDTQAKKLEGLLLAEQTIGTIKKQTDKLIDELYDLIEQER